MIRDPPRRAWLQHRRSVEDAVDLFESTRAPFEAACARLDLARALAALDRNDLAVQEARAAHGVLVIVDEKTVMGKRQEERN